MFEKDYKYSKINLMSNDDNFEPLFKTYLQENYKQIKNTYMYLLISS